MTEQNTSIDSDHVQVVTEQLSCEITALANLTNASRKAADGSAVAAHGGQRPPLRRVLRWTWYSTGAPLARRWDIPLFGS